jgi:hypothetical protein
MAALDITTPRAGARPGQLGLVRCGLTGAAVLAGVFAICWAAAAANIFPASHMYISLFTISPTASGDALAAGFAWSLAFGAIGGGLIAAVYNAFGFLERRG